jgi:hypothetical protein
MEEKFIKEIEITQKKQIEIWEIKASINQIWSTMGSIISKQDQREERISKI